jgi:hypothetical protein
MYFDFTSQGGTRKLSFSLNCSGVIYALRSGGDWFSVEIDQKKKIITIIVGTNNGDERDGSIEFIIGGEHCTDNVIDIHQERLCGSISPDNKITSCFGGEQKFTYNPNQ